MYISEAIKTSRNNRIWLKINGRWVEFHNKEIAKMWSLDPMIDHSAFNPQQISVNDALLIIKKQFDGEFPEIPFSV